MEEEEKIILLKGEKGGATGKTSLPRKLRHHKTVKPISSGSLKNQQLDLFQNFMANTDDEREGLSNAVDLWDNIPRYSVSRSRMNTMRTAEGFLEELEIPFQYRGRTFTAVIHPARVKGKDGQYKSYYPSAREELVEHALRKISASQQAGFFDQTDNRSGVLFSLRLLREELDQQGHSLRYDEIIEALEILSRGGIEIITTNEVGDEAFTVSNYFSALSGVKRKDYETDSNSKWAVQFHPLVTKSIDKLTYRQFNYRRLMQCRSQLARWLLNQLVLKYTQAAMLTPFEMRYSTIKRDSALLSGYGLERLAIAALDEAWDELIKLGALSVVNKNKQLGAHNKIEDIIYELFPTPGFIAEQKASNRRKADGNEIDST